LESNNFEKLKWSYFENYFCEEVKKFQVDFESLQKLAQKCGQKLSICKVKFFKKFKN